MKWVLAGILFLAVVGLLLVDWGGEQGHALDVLGSTSIQPFAEMLAEEFNRQGHPFQVEVQGGGSTAGLQAAENRVADIGMCSRALKDEEAQKFRGHTIARDGLAIVVHRANAIDGLTRQQIEQIFVGQTTNWKDVGGLDRPIRLITREEGSGTREAFTKLVMGKSRISRKALTQESNGAVKELVKDDPCAIGYMSLGLVGDELKGLKVDGVAPTGEAVVAKRYPLVRPFLFVTKGEASEHARQFMAFVMSAEGQAILEKEGLVRAQ